VEDKPSQFCMATENTENDYDDNNDEEYDDDNNNNGKQM
jgi:hypothetical protein